MSRVREGRWHLVLYGARRHSIPFWGVARAVPRDRAGRLPHGAQGRRDGAPPVISLPGSSIMLLIIGDSFAHHLATHLNSSWDVSCVGRRGARLSDESFRRWAIATTINTRPTRVLLIVGGNDVAHPTFEQRSLAALFEELSLGLLAAGADSVRILAIPPGTQLRAADVSAACFSRRQRVANSKLKGKFRRDPVMFRALCTSKGFLGRDGVHPSRRGWQTLCAVVRTLL